jgi:hypothetical protein
MSFRGDKHHSKHSTNDTAKKLSSGDNMYVGSSSLRLQWWVTTEGHKGTFWGDGNICYHNLGCGYIGVYI